MDFDSIRALLQNETKSKCIFNSRWHLVTPIVAIQFHCINNAVVEYVLVLSGGTATVRCLNDWPSR